MFLIFRKVGGNKKIDNHSEFYIRLKTKNEKFLERTDLLRCVVFIIICKVDLLFKIGNLISKFEQ